jgi:DNA replication protein DnaC
MSISQDIMKAQQQLAAKRPSTNEPQPIANLIQTAVNAPTPAPAAPPAELDNPETAVRSHVARLIQAGRVTLDTLDTSHPQVKQAVRMARLWGQRKRDGYTDASLILCGNNGVGKTHIAQAIWWSMCETVVDVMPGLKLEYGKPLPGYVPRPTGRFYLSNDLLSLMGQSRDTETGLILSTRAASVIGYPPLIVIDDIGLEQVIPFVKHEQQEEERHARLFKVINHCQSNISVIITSNKTWPELSRYIGKRVADRLLQMAPAVPGTGDSFIVDMFGVPSWRRRRGGR